MIRIAANGLFCLLLGCTASGLESMVSGRIEALGSEGTSVTDLEYLAERRCEALPLLAEELHTVPQRFLDTLETSQYSVATHQVWVIAALRYITGNEEIADDPDERAEGDTSPSEYFLRLHLPPDKTRFFGSWFSRGHIYFAGIDAQQEIIQGWKSFLASYDCRLPPPRYAIDVEFWFYGHPRDEYQ